MIKHSIKQPVSVGYKNARSLLEKKYGSPHYIVAAYRKEIKSWPQLKPADGAAYGRFITSSLNVKVQLMDRIGTLLITQK